MADTTKLYNTYGDLYDTPQIIYSDYGQPEEISPDTLKYLQPVITQ